VDSFNLFNFQAVTAVDQNYTFDNVEALVGGTEADLANLKVRGSDKAVAVNPNYQKPLSYQTPRSIRFGARLSF
jgi:hypothetical protein